MKKIIYTGIGILLLLSLYWIFKGDKETTISKKEANFAVRDTANITKIFLADKAGHSVLLTRNENGKGWTVDHSKPANQDVMNLFLENLTLLKVKAPVAKSRRKTVFKSMAATAVKVEIYGIKYHLKLSGNLKFFPYETKTNVYYVGGPTPNNHGSYMLMEGAERPFVVHILGMNGYVSPLFTPLAYKWRSHTIFHTRFQDIASVKVEFPKQEDASFEVLNKDGEFVLKSLKTGKVLPAYDTLKMYNFVTAFADVRFEAFRNDLPEKDSILQTTPEHIITLTDRKHQSYQVKTFASPDLRNRPEDPSNPMTFDVDRMYAEVNRGEDFVLIQYYVFDKLIRPLSYYQIK